MFYGDFHFVFNRKIMLNNRKEHENYNLKLRVIAYKKKYKLIRKEIQRGSMGLYFHKPFNFAKTGKKKVKLLNCY